MKKLSVIVAAYNAERYIDKCIESVISQGADIELIVVNDASTDRTAELVGKYKEKARLINLSKNSGSVAKVRNIGLESASGEYITYLDSDDWYENGALSKIIYYLERYNPDILKFNYNLVYPDGNRIIPPAATEKPIFVSKNEFNKYVYPRFIDGISLNSVCCAVFRRSLLKNVRFSEKYHTAEDAAFSIEAYTNAKTVLFVPDSFYCYYQSGKGLTGGGMSIFQKYKCNFMLAGKTLSFLPQWGMNTLSVKIRTLTRPVRLTIDKLKRM